MIYRIVKGKIEVIPEAASLVPSFSSLTENQLRFLIIAYDYTSSPYKMKPLSFREDMAEKITKIKRKDISQEIKDEFISCIYDIKRDKKELLQKKLISIQNGFETEESLTKLKELSSLMDFIEKKISDVDAEIIREDEMEVILKGERKLSLLEKIIRSRKLYNVEKRVNRIVDSSNNNESL